MNEFETLPAAVPFVTIENGRAVYAKQNEGVTPIFFHSTVQNHAKSENEGRPIFDEFEFCRILIAGDPHNAHVEPVTAAVIQRFAAEYAAWKATDEKRQHISGTPLRQWPMMTPAKIAEFEALNIFNVEGLANISEVHLQRGFDLREWRERARAYLESAKDGSTAARYAAENEKLRADIERLQGQMAGLTEQYSALLKTAEAAPVPQPAPVNSEVQELRDQMAAMSEQFAQFMQTQRGESRRR